MSKKEAKNYLAHFDLATYQTEAGVVNKITTAKEAKLSVIVLEFSKDGKQWIKVQEIQPKYENSGYLKQNEYEIKYDFLGYYRVSIYSDKNELVGYRQNKI
jgi:hypothetical protein